MGSDNGASVDRQDHNEVVLRGRVSAEPVSRALPSGDEMVTFRIVVRRPARARRRSRVSVDTFDCVAWTAALRRKAAGLAPGDVVDVDGSLRRRFRRLGGSVTSRTDVEVLRCHRVQRRRPSRGDPTGA